MNKIFSSQIFYIIAVILEIWAFTYFEKTKFPPSKFLSSTILLDFKDDACTPVNFLNLFATSE